MVLYFFVFSRDVFTLSIEVFTTRKPHFENASRMTAIIVVLGIIRKTVFPDFSPLFVGTNSTYQYTFENVYNIPKTNIVLFTKDNG